MKQIEPPPSSGELEDLIGKKRYDAWSSLCRLIEQKYETDRFWNQGGKEWKYEYKYRRGGKTLCALYAKENAIGFLIVLGKKERAEFETLRPLFSDEIRQAYDKAATYHDGKWMMLEVEDTDLSGDIARLLQIKRKPDKKFS